MSYVCLFSVQWSCEKAVSTTNAVLRRTQKCALGKCGVLTSAMYLVLGLILYKLEGKRCSWALPSKSLETRLG